MPVLARHWRWLLTEILSLLPQQPLKRLGRCCCLPCRLYLLRACLRRGTKAIDLDIITRILMDTRELIVRPSHHPITTRLFAPL